MAHRTGSFSISSLLAIGSAALFLGACGPSTVTINSGSAGATGSPGTAGADSSPMGRGGTTGAGGTGGSAGGGGATGTPGSGGAGTTGTGGSSNAGVAGATGGTSTSGAGGASNPADPIPSAGCSATPTTTSTCTSSASSPCTLDVNGTTREYYLNLPSGYDGKKPVPVVWEYHPLGGNAKQGITMYQLNNKLTNVIFVSPQGLTSGGNAGFPNTNGQDEAMTRAINAVMEAKYCIDKGRYFATGFSYGGSMSYTAACNMSDVFRAIGAMSGAPISGATCTSKKPARPVAVWATHGDADTALPITLAQPIIDSLVKYNGCATTTQPVDPSPCVAYDGCMPGYPVVWCVRPGDPHAIPSFAAAAITKFFQQF